MRRGAAFPVGSERAHCGGAAAARKIPDTARRARFASGCCFMRTYLSRDDSVGPIFFDHGDTMNTEKNEGRNRLQKITNQ